MLTHDKESRYGSSRGIRGIDSMAAWAYDRCMKRRARNPFLFLCWMSLLIAGLASCPINVAAQGQDREDEIVASLAGGQVIVHVARDGNIVFGAIDQPVEAGGVPPRVVDLDAHHVGVLLGASEWRVPAEPKPVRLDKDFQRVTVGKDAQQYRAYGDAEQDLETIGTSFLEKLRPLVGQLHHKLDVPPDDPLLEVVMIGYGLNSYGPEVWTVEYRIQQEQVSTRGDYWQTRVLRPRFTQLYPPEKHAARTIVEARYPAEGKGPTLAALIQSDDPIIEKLRSGDVRFAKVIEAVDHGQAQKAAPDDAANFMRAVLPLMAGSQKFILGKMEESHGFEWIVPPEEPVEKAQKEDKNRPPEAPSLLRRPKP